MPLALLSDSFQSLPLLPTSKLGPSGADSWVGGLVDIPDPVGLSSDLSCEAVSFSCLLNPNRTFQSEVLRLYFPILKLWVMWSVWLLSCPSRFICTQMWDHPVCNPPPHQVCQLWPCHASSAPGCLSLPLLLVWMNVSSLTPWLSDFHTVQFSVNSGWFCF